MIQRAPYLPNTHSQNNSKAPKFPKVRKIMVFQSSACNELKYKKRDKKAQKGLEKDKIIQGRLIWLSGLFKKENCLNHFKMCMNNQGSTRVKSSSGVQVNQSAITHEEKLDGM